MSNPLRTPEDYELFLYTLTEQYSSIVRSTVTFIRVGGTLAKVAGEIHFDKGYQLVVRERILYYRLPAMIDWYGYEVWKSSEKLYWYDAQPHPNDQSLQITHPHHKHVLPDVKHHRIPAPGMSFNRPNIPFLVKEIEGLIEQDLG